MGFGNDLSVTLQYFLSCSAYLIHFNTALHQEQLTAVRALQLSGNVAVCPPGL